MINDNGYRISGTIMVGEMVAVIMKIIVAL